MSKSKGNIADPKFLCDRYSVDAIRYYLLREVPFGSDGVYSTEMLISRINSDLANVYGNLVNRTLAMITQYFGGKLEVPSEDDYTELDRALIDRAVSLYAAVTESMDKLDAPKALEEIFKLFSASNKYIDDTTPWVLNKEKNYSRLKTVMYVLAECIRIGTVMLRPFLTSTPDKVFGALNLTEDAITFDSTTTFGAIKETVVNKIDPLFNRLDLNKELAYAEEVNKAQEKPAPTPSAPVEKKAPITFDDFMKTELKVGKVIACEKIAKSKKLLKSTVKIGDETRTIVSGIAEYYSPEDMVGKSVVVVTNLLPAKLCGVVSEGMILCADSDGKVVIVSPETLVADGATVR